MSTIKIGLACAYCFLPVVFSQGAIELRGKHGMLREGEIATVKCPHCDSKFTVCVKTKRKTKGARRHAQEIEAKRKADERYRAAQERNDRIGAALLAQPGCTCAADMKRDEERYGRGGRSMGKDGDHPLVTSWTNGLPNEPQHRHGCPLRRSAEEAALLDSFAHNAKTGAA